MILIINLSTKFSTPQVSYTLKKHADVSSKRCSCFPKKMLMFYRTFAHIFQKHADVFSTPYP